MLGEYRTNQTSEPVRLWPGLVWSRRLEIGSLRAMGFLDPALHASEKLRHWHVVHICFGKASGLKLDRIVFHEI
jgi:hypothetical protein